MVLRITSIRIETYMLYTNGQGAKLNTALVGIAINDKNKIL